MFQSIFADIARSITEAANESEYVVTINNAGWDPKQEHYILDHMQSQQVAGIIIKPTAFYEPGTFDSVRVPLVVFWHLTKTRLILSKWIIPLEQNLQQII